MLSRAISPPTLQLQQQDVVLSQNGKKWSGSLTVGVDHMVLIYCYVAGIAAEAWSLDVTTDCPKGSPDKIYSDADKIPHGGSYAFYTSAKVPDNLCGLAAVVLADIVVAPATKSGKLKN